MQTAKKFLLTAIGVIIYILAVPAMFQIGRSFPGISPALIRIIFAAAAVIILLLSKIMPVEQLKGIGRKSFKIYAYPIIFSCLYLIIFISVYIIMFGTQYFQDSQMKIEKKLAI